MHLKVLRKNEWTFSHCLVGVIHPRGLIYITKVQDIQNKVNNPNVSFTLIVALQQLNKMHVGCDIVIQCSLILGLSPKDTCLYPNTLHIRSLLGVNFWVFYPKDLTHFLIRLSWAFIFHHYFIFLSFSFHAILQQIFIFLHTTMMHMKCNEITYHHPQMSWKIPTNPNINKT